MLEVFEEAKEEIPEPKQPIRSKSAARAPLQELHQQIDSLGGGRAAKDAGGMVSFFRNRESFLGKYDDLPARKQKRVQERRSRLLLRESVYGEGDAPGQGDDMSGRVAAEDELFEEVKE